MTNEQFGPPVNTAAYGYELRGVGQFGIAASALVLLTVVASVADTWSDWHRYNLLDDILNGDRQISIDEAISADNLASVTSWSAIGMYAVAAIVFLVWLWRARRNAEQMCDAEHRRGRGWVIGAWICPVVNLWFPFMVVDDIQRASRPDNPPDLVALSTVPGSGQVRLWWGLFLTAGVTGWISVRAAGDLDSVGAFKSLAVFDTVRSILLAGAAVLLILIIRQVSTWQDRKVIFPG